MLKVKIFGFYGEKKGEKEIQAWLDEETRIPVSITQDSVVLSADGIQEIWTTITIFYN